MPRKPVEVKAIQWAKVFKVINDAGRAGIGVRDLAEEFDVEPDSPELLKAIELLTRQRRIRVSTGYVGNAEKGTRTIGRIVQALAVGEDKSARERIQDDEEV